MEPRLCLYCGCTDPHRTVICPRCGKARVSHLADNRFRFVRSLVSATDVPAVEVFDESVNRRALMRFALPSTIDARRDTLTNEARLLREFEGAGPYPEFFTAGVLRPTGQPFVVQGYVEGTPLPDGRYKAQPTEIGTCLLRMAAALEPLHAAGYVHAEVKPSRFFVLPSGEVTLTHLSAACLAGSPSRGTGCPGYRPAEQRDTMQPLGPATDVWALGACGYVLLTGKMPLGSRETGRPGLPIAPPSTYNPLVTPRLDALLLQALAEAPGERFSSATPLRDALVTAFGRITVLDGSGPAFSPAWSVAVDDLREHLDLLDQRSAAVGKAAWGFLQWLDTPWRRR